MLSSRCSQELPFNAQPRLHRHCSPSPSEQSIQTVGTNAVSLFSHPNIDACSDNLSVTTNETGDVSSLYGANLWSNRCYQASTNGYNVGPPSSVHPIRSDTHGIDGTDLFEFLKQAELEQYYTALTTHLKIRTVEQIKYVEESDLADLGFSRPEQRRLRKHFKRECPQTPMGKLYKRLSISASRVRASSVARQLAMNDNHAPQSMNKHANQARSFTNLTQESNVKPTIRPTECKPECRVIPMDQLQIGALLGEGDFGKVHQGIWLPPTGDMLQVAIKSIGSHHLDPPLNHFTDLLLTELAVLQQHGHPDLIRLHGVCWGDSNSTIGIVTELAPLRSLLECVRAPELRSSFPIPILHRFAVQIARGMSYLEEVGIVHQNLAARNILVLSKNMVKIGDIGMPRALQLEKSYYRSNYNVNLKLPIAWCAPECITQSQFTSASDVWAYGVTLWEMFTYGFTPWAGLTGQQIMETIVASSSASSSSNPNQTRLNQPDACPDAVYDAVMRACWTHNSASRPTFEQLLALLPRLCPEERITSQDYYPPHSDSRTDVHAASVDDFTMHTDLLSPTPISASGSHNRPLGRLLTVRSNELVHILGKRSSHSWKVVIHRTGQIGFLPSSILVPVNQTAKLSAAHSKSSINGEPTENTMKRISRRGSLADLAFRNTLSRFQKPGSSGRSKSTAVTSTVERRHLTSDQISEPKDDFQHVVHLSSTGRSFGDLGILELCSGSAYPPHTLVSSAEKKETATMKPPTDPRPKSRIFRSSSTTPALKKLRILDPLDAALSHPQKRNVNNEDNSVSFPELDDVMNSLNFDFGGSLLDEVFKCIKLDPMNDSLTAEHSSVRPSTTSLTQLRSEEHCAEADPTTDIVQCENDQEVLPQHNRVQSTHSVCQSIVSPSLIQLPPKPLSPSTHTLLSSHPAVTSTGQTAVPVAPPNTDSESDTTNSRWKRGSLRLFNRRSASVSKLAPSVDDIKLGSPRSRKCESNSSELSRREAPSISHPVLIDNAPRFSVSSSQRSSTTSTLSETDSNMTISTHQSSTRAVSTSNLLPHPPTSNAHRGDHTTSPSLSPSLQSLNTGALRNTNVSSSPDISKRPMGARVLRSGDLIFRADPLSHRHKSAGVEARHTQNVNHVPTGDIRSSSNRPTEYLHDGFATTRKLRSRLDGLGSQPNGNKDMKGGGVPVNNGVIDKTNGLSSLPRSAAVNSGSNEKRGTNGAIKDSHLPHPIRLATYDGAPTKRFDLSGTQLGPTLIDWLDEPGLSNGSQTSVAKLHAFLSGYQ